MRAAGVPWAEICKVLGVSRRTAYRRLREFEAGVPDTPSTNGAAFQGDAVAHVPADDEVDLPIAEATALLRMAARGGSAPAARALLAEARRAAEVRCQSHFEVEEVKAAMYGQWRTWETHLDALARRVVTLTGADYTTVHDLIGTLKDDVSAELEAYYSSPVPKPKQE